MFYYAIDKKTEIIKMDPQFLMFLRWIRHKERDEKVLSILSFIIDNGEKEDSLGTLDKDGKEVFFKYIFPKYVITAQCARCGKIFNWRDLVGIPSVEANSKKVYFHKKCFAQYSQESKASLEEAYRSQF